MPCWLVVGGIACLRGSDSDWTFSKDSGGGAVYFQQGGVVTFKGHRSTRACGGRESEGLAGCVVTIRQGIKGDKLRGLGYGEGVGTSSAAR